MRHFPGVLVMCCCLAHGVFAGAPCSSQAIAQAKKLLRFHMEDAENIAISPEVKRLPPLVNPANKKQKFEVLEVWGRVYKGLYRMRLIYYPMEDECVLMGQEILEYADL